MNKPTTKTVNISLPTALLHEIDKAAKKEYSSRSDFIRETIVRRLKGQRIVDEWGDEGHWEVISDFTKIHPEGVPIEDILKALDKMTK